MKFVLVIMMGFGMSSCSTMNKKSTNMPNTSRKEDTKSPALTAPKVNKIWIPEKIEGDKFIEGHYIWILEKTTSWSQ